MGDIHVYLEGGFDDDRVVVSVGGEEHERPTVRTQTQVGLADVVDLATPDGRSSVLRVALPDRDLAVDVTVDPAVTPHVRVDLADGELVVRPETELPRFA